MRAHSFPPTPEGAEIRPTAQSPGALRFYAATLRPGKVSSASSPTHPVKKFERMRTSHPVGQDQQSSERWLFRGRQALASPVSGADQELTCS